MSMRSFLTPFRVAGEIAFGIFWILRFVVFAVLGKSPFAERDGEDDEAPV